VQLRIWPLLPGCALCNSAGLFASEQELFAELNCVLWKGCVFFVFLLLSCLFLPLSSIFLWWKLTFLFLGGRPLSAIAYLNRVVGAGRVRQKIGKEELVWKENLQRRLRSYGCCQTSWSSGNQNACSLGILKHSENINV